MLSTAAKLDRKLVMKKAEQCRDAMRKPYLVDQLLAQITSTSLDMEVTESSIL